MYPPIFEIVADDATVQSLLGSNPVRFWPFGEAPQNETRPYALHQLLYGSPENTLSCPPDMDLYGVQVDVYAQTITEARNIAGAIREALEDDCYMVSHNGEYREPSTKLYRVAMTFEFLTPR